MHFLADSLHMMGKAALEVDMKDRSADLKRSYPLAVFDSYMVVIAVVALVRL